MSIHRHTVPSSFLSVIVKGTLYWLVPNLDGCANLTNTLLFIITLLSILTTNTTSTSKILCIITLLPFPSSLTCSKVIWLLYNSQYASEQAINKISTSSNFIPLLATNLYCQLCDDCAQSKKIPVDCSFLIVIVLVLFNLV